MSINDTVMFSVWHWSVPGGSEDCDVLGHFQAVLQKVEP